MNKDFIYEDKGQFRLLQNARRIGSYVVGDQGIVPSERVLTELKFAHQPVFRMPVEERVIPFYYLQLYDFVVAVEEKRHWAGDWWANATLDVQGLIAKSAPTAAAKALEAKFVQGDWIENPGYLTTEERQLLATYYLNDKVALSTQKDLTPRLFKDGFYGVLDWAPEPPAESLWHGESSGKFAIKSVQKVLDVEMSGILFLYKDVETYDIAIKTPTGGVVDIYTSTGWGGPWTRINTLRYADPALASLAQKDCRRLLRAVGYFTSGPDMPSFPLSLPVKEGRSGELAGLLIFSNGPLNNVGRHWGDGYVPPNGSCYVIPCRLRRKADGIELTRLNNFRVNFKNGKSYDFTTAFAGTDF